MGRAGGSTWGTLGFRGHYLPSGCATEVVMLSLKVGMAKNTARNCSLLFLWVLALYYL